LKQLEEEELNFNDKSSQRRLTSKRTSLKNAPKLSNINSQLSLHAAEEKADRQEMKQWVDYLIDEKFKIGSDKWKSERLTWDLKKQQALKTIVSQPNLGTLGAQVAEAGIMGNQTARNLPNAKPVEDGSFKRRVSASKPS
jgi:hypothetical protein